MKIKQFPKLVFVSVYVEGSGDEWLNASLTKDAALGDDQRKRVGIYKLLEVQEVTKSLPQSRKVKSKSTIGY